jgi:hypothetical protein
MLAVFFGLLFCSGVASYAQDRSARAKELIGQAREALGGDARLAAVQGLSMTATFKRELTEDMQVDGEFELSFLLPDKFKRVETMNLPVGGASVTRIEGLNGDQRFADSRTSSAGGGAIMIRRPDDQPGAQANAIKATRADFARNLLALLLTSSQTVPLELSYAGEAKSEDGTAMVIEAKSSDGFSARLFLDKQTHQPLMLTYKTLQPPMRLMTHRAASREEFEKKRKELEAQPHDEGEAKEVEVQVFLSDYRSVDGVQLPHRISRAVDGKPTEEWDVKKYKLNPPLKPESFKN